MPGCPFLVGILGTIDSGIDPRYFFFLAFFLAGFFAAFFLFLGHRVSS